jgi:hypothetical protein
MSQVSPHQLTAPTPCDDWTVGQLSLHLADHLKYIATVDTGLDDLDHMVTFREGGGEWRLEAALAATALELTTHAWDLARAIGVDDAINPEVLATLWERFLADGPGPPRGPGLIGPPVPMPASDPLHERFLGMMGRNPYAPMPAAAATVEV